jgi:HD-GYP domain-containing protein (c-di-GMP phosphodiesterase class II)
MAVAMAERAGLGPEGTRDLMRAALLHDTNKLGISNRILDKPGGLTDGEYEEIKQHPKLTHDILSRVGPFGPIAETGREPPREARRLRLPPAALGPKSSTSPPAPSPSPTSTTLSAERPYHKAMPREKVLGILSEEGGTKIDPGCVAILEELAAKDAL